MKTIQNLPPCHNQADRDAINKLFEGKKPYTKKEFERQLKSKSLVARVANHICEKQIAAQDLVHRCSKIRKSIKGLNVMFYNEDGKALKC